MEKLLSTILAASPYILLLTGAITFFIFQEKDKDEQNDVKTRLKKSKNKKINILYGKTIASGIFGMVSIAVLTERNVIKEGQTLVGTLAAILLLLPFIYYFKHLLWFSPRKNSLDEK